MSMSMSMKDYDKFFWIDGLSEEDENVPITIRKLKESKEDIEEIKKISFETVKRNLEKEIEDIRKSDYSEEDKEKLIKLIEYEIKRELNKASALFDKLYLSTDPVYNEEYVINGTRAIDMLYYFNIINRMARAKLRSMFIQKSMHSRTIIKLIINLSGNVNITRDIDPNIYRYIYLAMRRAILPYFYRKGWITGKLYMWSEDIIQEAVMRTFLQSGEYLKFLVGVKPVIPAPPDYIKEIIIKQHRGEKLAKYEEKQLSTYNSEIILRLVDFYRGYIKADKKNGGRLFAFLYNITKDIIKRYAALDSFFNDVKIVNTEETTLIDKEGNESKVNIVTVGLYTNIEAEEDLHEISSVFHKIIRQNITRNIRQIDYWGRPILYIKYDGKFISIPKDEEKKLRLFRLLQSQGYDILDNLYARVLNEMVHIPISEKTRDIEDSFFEDVIKSIKEMELLLKRR